MRFSLKKKTVILLVTITALLSSAIIIVSGNFFGDITDDLYKNRAKDMSNTVAAIVDVEAAGKLRDNVLSIYDKTEKKVLSDEWGSPEFNAYIAEFSEIEKTPEFGALREQMRSIQDVNDVDCVYLCCVDTERKYVVYLVDAAYEEVCPPGCIDVLYEENWGILDDPSVGLTPYTTKTEQYGWLVTAGAPVYGKDGSIICYACADVSMDSLKAEQREFMLALTALLAVLTILICIAGIMVVDHIIVRPINMLSTAAAGYSHNNQNGLDRIDIRTKDEIGSLYISLKQMTRDINKYIDNLISTTNELARARNKADRMDRLAHKDALTGVWSKLAYEKKVDELTEEIQRGNCRFGIAVADMNNLKKLNDTYGHEKGDLAIKKMCSIICDVFKRSPVYRYGGDEFVIVLKNKDLENVDALVQEFNDRIDATAGLPWEKVSAAIGYAVYDGDDTVNDVFRRADYSMYERKKDMKHLMKKKKKAAEKKERETKGK